MPHTYTRRSAAQQAHQPDWAYRLLEQRWGRGTLAALKLRRSWVRGKDEKALLEFLRAEGLEAAVLAPPAVPRPPSQRR